MAWRPAAQEREGLREFSLAVISWGVLRVALLKCVGLGWGSDVARYAWFARSWAAGRTPYRAFPVEYPPGAMPVFLVPWLAGGDARYARSFAVEMMACDLAVLLWVVATARRLSPASPRRSAVPIAAYLVSTELLFPVLYARFDLAATVFAVLALHLVLSGRFAAGALVLGLGGGVKVWPLLLAPLVTLFTARERGPKPAARVLGLVALGSVALALPFLPAAGGRVFAFVGFHSGRGIQLESTWATLALLLGDAGAIRVAFDHTFGAIHLSGRAAAAFAAASGPAVLVLALTPLLLAARRGFGERGEEKARRVTATAAATITGALLGAKVLSPQFLLWAVPLWAVSLGGAAVAAAPLSCALTAAVYPWLWPALLGPGPGHALAVAALASRNLLLVAIYVVLLRRISRSGG